MLYNNITRTIQCHDQCGLFIKINYCWKQSCIIIIILFYGGIYWGRGGGATMEDDILYTIMHNLQFYHSTYVGIHVRVYTSHKFTSLLMHAQPKML